MVNPLTFKPLHDWVVIRIEKRRSRSKGGVHLPQATTGVEKVMEGDGIIISIGPGKLRKNGVRLPPEDIEVGNRVTFRRYLKDAQPLEKVDGYEYSLFRADDLQGVLSEDATIGQFS